MRKDAYIDGVMARMNELGWDDSLSGMFLGGDTSKVERHIALTYVDAWRRSVGMFPLSYYHHASFLGGRHEYDKSVGTGYVVVPSDYYGLSEFRMRGWRRSCYAAIDENNNVLSVQSNEYVRGNYVRPVCTLGIHPLYGKVINYYSIPKGDEHVVTRAMYVPLVKSLESLSNADDIIKELRATVLLVEPLMWVHTGIVFSEFEKFDAAKIAFDMAKLII